MILSAILLASGGTVAGWHVRRYRKNTKKVTLISSLNQASDTVHVLIHNTKEPEELHWLAATKTSLTEFQETHIIPMFNNTLGQQVLGLVDSETDEDTVAQHIDRHLAISFVSLGFASIGGFYYPPLALLSVPGLIYTSLPFVQYAIETVRRKEKVGAVFIDMICIVGTLAGGYFLATSLESVVFYGSQKMLLKTQNRSRNDLVNIFSDQPRFVSIVRDGVEIERDFDSLQLNDIVVINAGQSIPIDGVVTYGAGTVDQRTLTGESQPVEKCVGERVLSVTILLTGRLHVRVEQTGEDTVAAQIGDILSATADFRSKILSRGQTIVDGGALPTLLLSAVTLPLLGLQSALAILYCSFGYSMRIAAPLGVLNFLRITSDQGILVKDGRSLELLSQIDTVVFDKTGTLTEEAPSVGRIHHQLQYNETDLLILAAAGEQKQSHPIARAILNEAKNRGLTIPPIDEATYKVSHGLKVKIQQQTVHIGSIGYMQVEAITIPKRYQGIEASSHKQGHSLVYVAIDYQLAGAIEIVPTIRVESIEIISELHKRNIDTIIISGDQEQPTQTLANKLGIEHYFADVLPSTKAQLITQLQSEGRSVCFIGDGINDAIALKTAQVGISMRGASTIATDSAGIILIDGTLKQLIPLLDIAKQLDKNLTVSTISTIVPGIIGVGGVLFFHLGIMGSMLLFNAGIALSVTNAMLPAVQHEYRKLAE